ncbi:Zinc metalloprotease TldD [Candidatus Bilamarchaeum dharawalense]|uniref:Zinc metalloprotease TldD n=1 Tax=Candidatus Bilamarchaeum dharawalense TaxID=2885759 RepID=A0A5E4LUS1_9ARCH|nr:Zinc metalloprotease TldD [Candidatus Bilamarchaeum dharawalense]
MPEHEIFSFSSKSTSLAFSGGELKTKETDSVTGYGIRVLHDGRLGFCYCQKESDLKKTIDNAREVSRFSAKTKFSFPEKSSFTMPDTVDKSVDPEDFNSLKDFVESARSAAEIHGGKSRIICSADNSSIKLENTSGFLGEYGKSTFSIYAECMHDDGFGFAYCSSIKKPDSVSEIGSNAANMAKEMRGAKKPDPGSYLLVVDVEALDSILGPLLTSFSGDWKRRGVTKVTKTKMFSDQLSIYEDGLAQATDSRPFDDEGTPSKQNKLIENGEVKSFLYDRETAALENVAESGACSRASYSSVPGIGSSNIVIEKGNCKDLAEFGKHIELLSAHGSHTANLTSGDIGLEVSTAFLVENGKKKPVKGFMLSGNLFEMFANIEAIESESKVYGSVIAPRIAFKNIKVVS